MTKSKTYTPEEIAELEAAREQATRKAHEACTNARPIKAPDGRTWTPTVIIPASWPGAVVGNAGVLAWTCGGLAVHAVIGKVRAFKVSLASTGHGVHAHNHGAGEPRACAVIRAGMMLDAFDGWETLNPNDAATLKRCSEATEAARDAEIAPPEKAKRATPAAPRAFKAGGVTFTPGTFQAAYAGARFPREGWIAGGLVVHKVVDRDGVGGKGYKVSQAASGGTVAPAVFATRAEAAACAVKVLGAVDWTRDFYGQGDNETTRIAVDAVRAVFPAT